MCATCGCGSHSILISNPAGERAPPAQLRIRDAVAPATPAGAHAVSTRLIAVERDLLESNDRQATKNRQDFARQRQLVLNLVSSPGSGKTTLLVSTLRLIQSEYPVAVIEGDQQTSQDADRIRATGVQAVQINTGKGCHLDASMIVRALDQLSFSAGGMLFIENVGNLVCPAAFDLGEAAKVVVLSVTEGEDKPLKYPDMFRAARLMLLNKCDLLPHLDFDTDLAMRYAREVNPDIEILLVSAKNGQGMEDWLNWLKQAHQTAQTPA